MSNTIMQKFHYVECTPNSNCSAFTLETLMKEGIPFRSKLLDDVEECQVNDDTVTVYFEDEASPAQLQWLEGCPYIQSTRQWHSEQEVIVL